MAVYQHRSDSVSINDYNLSRDKYANTAECTKQRHFLLLITDLSQIAENTQSYSKKLKFR